MNTTQVKQHCTESGIGWVTLTLTDAIRPVPQGPLSKQCVVKHHLSINRISMVQNIGIKQVNDGEMMVVNEMKYVLKISEP
jgi:hypothetical protein